MIYDIFETILTAPESHKKSFINSIRKTIIYDNFSNWLIKLICQAFDKIEQVALDIYQNKFFKNIFKICILVDDLKINNTLISNFKLHESPVLLSIYAKELRNKNKDVSHLQKILVLHINKCPRNEVDFVFKSFGITSFSLVDFAIQNNIAHKELIRVCLNYSYNIQDVYGLMEIVELLIESKNCFLIFSAGALLAEHGDAMIVQRFIETLPQSSMAEFFQFIIDDSKYQMNHSKIVFTCSDSIVKINKKWLSEFENILINSLNGQLLLDYCLEKIYSNKKTILIGLNKCGNKYYINRFYEKFPEHLRLRSWG
jgi:hypothetical protein